jgi:hypothetical protein
MNITLTGLLLAAGAGVAGCLTGGMEAFIIYGFVLIFQTAMQAAGADLPFFTQYASGLFFMPCIFFSADVAAVGYAARKHDIREWEIDRSLAFTNDPMVLLVGALTGLAGYVLFSFAEYMHLPLDTGSFSVVVVAILARCIFRKDKLVNKDAGRVFRNINRWIFDLTVAGVVSALTAYFYKSTGILTVGFMMSAALLTLQLFQRTQFFPTTHQITMVSALAMAASGSYLAAILFGMLAQIIFSLFGGYLNMGCGTHIDPPAVAILTCSLLINIIF